MFDIVQRKKIINDNEWKAVARKTTCMEHKEDQAICVHISAQQTNNENIERFTIIL